MRLLVAGIVIAFTIRAEARIWTSSEGKTVEAELIRVEFGNAYLRPDGKTKLYPFRITDLSQADQKYIKQFEKDEEERDKQKRIENRRLRWHTDFAKAKAESEECQLPILFLYTAPAWCGWCRVLEDNILETDEFKKYAQKNLVYYIADFSDRDEGDEWKKENADLYRKFPGKGFPTTYFISVDGENIGHIGGCEKEWEPSDFIEKLEGFKTAKPAQKNRRKRKK